MGLDFKKRSIRMPKEQGFVYEFFYEGFFGYSLEQNFFEWSFAHFAPIILLGLAIFLTYRYRTKIAAWRHEENLRYVLAALLIFTESFYYWRLLYVGNGGSQDAKQMLTYLPIQVCEMTAYFAAFMLMKKSKNFYDIVFYIALTLGIIPLFTPAVIMQAGPAYARYYQFWIQHTVPIYSVFYMMFVHGFRSSYKKVYKPFIALGVMAVIAIIANNLIEGANFMYLASGTDGDSIANLLPESIPVRLVLYLGILCVLFFLVSLPEIIGIIKEKRAKKLKDKT
jgi:hypothetical integral membrane protein (TIGR02206 family)